MHSCNIQKGFRFALYIKQITQYNRSYNKKRKIKRYDTQLYGTTNELRRTRRTSEPTTASDQIMSSTTATRELFTAGGKPHFVPPKAKLVARRCLRRGHPYPLVLDRRTPSHRQVEKLTPEHAWTGQPVAEDRTTTMATTPLKETHTSPPSPVEHGHY